MTQPIHIMLDLETWGTEPGCDIRSIGACVFDPVAGWVGAPGEFNPKRIEYFYVATDNPTGSWGTGVHRSRFFKRDTWRRKYPLTRDPRTVQWWSEQSEAAQAAFADPVDLKDGLERFAQWVFDVANRADNWDYDNPNHPYPDDIRLWSHGAATDGPWLAAAYKACGLPVPWHHRAPRDTRTIFDAAGITDYSAWLAQTPGPLGIEHHALDDAICQARAVCGAWEIIRTERQVFSAQSVVPAAEGNTV